MIFGGGFALMRAPVACSSKSKRLKILIPREHLGLGLTARMLERMRGFAVSRLVCCVVLKFCLQLLQIDHDVVQELDRS